MMAEGASHGFSFRGRVLIAGAASGPALCLEEPLSLWGGLDPETGLVIDARHPQAGASVRGKVLVMPWGRGSSSASSILLETVRLGTAPAAILLEEPDGILALGAAVARELYETAPPIVVLAPAERRALRQGDMITVTADGRVRAERGRPSGER